MNFFIFRNAPWNKRKRPKIKIWLTIFDLILEITGAVAVLAIWILLLATYSKLPEIIPKHYNGLGQVDAFGDKNEIITLPVITTILYAGMTILSRFPHVFNYTVSITEDNAVFQYRNMARMVRCLNLGIVLFFGSMLLQTIRHAFGNAAGLGIWFIPVFLGIIVVPMIYFLVKSFMYR